MKEVCVHFSTVPVAGSLPKEVYCSPSWACLIALEPLMNMGTQWWTCVPVAALSWVSFAGDVSTTLFPE